MTETEYKIILNQKRNAVELLFFANKISEERYNWLKGNISQICCELAEPMDCVGSFCCNCPVCHETHKGAHE